jgi:hypothetical protein
MNLLRGRCGLSASWGGRPSGVGREAEYYSLEELGFLLFEKGAGTLLQVGTVGNPEPLGILGKLASWHCLQRLPLSSPFEAAGFFALAGVW